MRSEYAVDGPGAHREPHLRLGDRVGVHVE